MSTEDNKLVAECLGGDSEAFSRLYDAHAGRVMAYLLRSGFPVADAEDLTQETFARIFRSMGSFDGERGNLRAWIGAIARNVARRHFGRRSNLSRIEPSMVDEMFAAEGSPGDSPEAREEAQAVRECVEALPNELKRIIRMRYIMALTTRGIAQSAKVPESTVRQRITEAKDAIQRCLRGKGVVE